MSEPQPRLRPTEPATLVVAGLATAALGWLLISRFYGAMPRMTWAPVILIGVLAVFEAVAAQDIWARVHRRGPGVRLARLRKGPPTRRTEPLIVVRFAVLAKASSLGGAIFAGWYAGLLPWLVIESQRLAQAAADLPAAIGGLVASLALIAAALWLERACRVPEPPEDEEGDAA